MRNSITTSRSWNVLTAVLVMLLANVNANAQSGGAIYEEGPDMMRAKIVPVASQLENGNIISFGGREAGFVPSAYADIYNPATNVFTEMPMNSTHDFAAVAKLENGNYFIAGGGRTVGIPAYANTEIYDVNTNTFIAKASMNSPRMMATAVELSDGKVLIAGAWYQPNIAATAELYDPVTDSFATSGLLNEPKVNVTLLPTTDGGAVLAGGMQPYGGSVFNYTEYYNPLTNTFEILSEQLFSDEEGWQLITLDTRPIDDARMNNGNYILMAARYTPSVEYILVEFNPDTKIFTKINTSQPISGEFTNGGFYNLVLNREDNLVYALGFVAGIHPTQVAFGQLI